MYGLLLCCEWIGVWLLMLFDEMGIDFVVCWLFVEGVDGVVMMCSLLFDWIFECVLVVYV